MNAMIIKDIRNDYRVNEYDVSVARNAYYDARSAGATDAELERLREDWFCKQAAFSARIASQLSRR